MCRFNHVVPPVAQAGEAPDELGGPIFDDLSGLNWFDVQLPEFNKSGPQVGGIKPEDALSPDSNDLDMAEELDLYELFKDDEVSKTSSPSQTPAASKPSESASAGNVCGLTAFQQQLQQQQQLAAAQFQFMNPALLALSQPMPMQQRATMEQLLAMQNAAGLLQNLPFLMANKGSSKGASSGTSLAVEDNAIEKVKQKRRESAQRSRARKNCYMRQLELENRALKEEVVKLTQALGKIQQDLQAGNISLGHRSSALAAPAALAGLSGLMMS